MRELCTDYPYLRHVTHPAPRGPTRCRDPIPIRRSETNDHNSFDLSLETTKMTSRTFRVLNSNNLNMTIVKGASIMTARQLFTRAAICFVACILLASTSLLPAVTLTWVGDQDEFWNTDNAGNTNWSGDALPMSGDDLVFVNNGSANFHSGLNLNGQTYQLNSITVGNSGDTVVNGLSDFGVASLVIGQNGTVDLGAGGIDVTMAAIAGFPAEHRNIALNNNINVTANSTIDRRTNASSGTQNRILTLGGTISGASNLDITNNASNIAQRTISLTKDSALTGDLKVTGNFHLNGNSDFGDNNQVTFGNAVSGYTYLLNYSGTATQDTDYEFSTTNWLQLGRFGGTGQLTLNGDMTGGATGQRLRIYSNGSTRGLIFAGDVQDFSNFVEIIGNSKVTIANSNGSGVAWENAAYVRLNHANYNSSTVTTDFLLQGDHTLHQLVQVGNNTNNNTVHLGQTNDGVISSDATFTGRIDVQETDKLVLNLTADTGSSATFNGEININSAGGVGGGFGLNKIGAGTVIINDRVSEDLGNSIAIGASTVQAGTLLINSTTAQGGFNVLTLTADVGAILGGTGQINGNVAIDGALMGEVSGLGNDPLDISGSLTLGAASILEINGSLNALTTYIIAQAGSLSGVFDSVYFNGVLVIDGELIGGTHSLSLLDSAVTLQGIPEPSSLLLLGMGVCVLVRRGRRHGKRKSA